MFKQQSFFCVLQFYDRYKAEQNTDEKNSGQKKQTEISRAAILFK